MRLIKYFSFAVFAICLASCSSKKTSEESSEDSTEATVESVDDETTDLSSSDNSNEEETSSSSSSSSEDWDELLDSYEECVTKYISFIKKAKDGDMSAMAEYASFMEEAQEYADKMSGAESEMSSSQWSRYMKITSKMTKAASEMANM